MMDKTSFLILLAFMLGYFTRAISDMFFRDLRSEKMG